MKMEVYTPDLELIGILENWDGLIIDDCAFTSGSFSFTSILSETTKTLLREDNIIWFDGETAGIIEYFDKTSDEYGISFTVKGSLLCGILKRRVLWGLYNYNASPTKILYDTVGDCVITPTRGNTEARKISGFVLSEQPEDARTIRKQQTGGDLLSFCEEVGQATNTAFGVKFDPATPSMQFWCRPCVNRSINQSDNDPVFYSTELDDVLSANYSYDSSGYSNVAFVQGEGEGANRANTTVYKEIQTVTPPEEPSLLPDGYTQLDYIESTGTQYIDTGFIATFDTRVQAKLQITSIPESASCLFGVQNTSSNMFLFKAAPVIKCFQASFQTNSVNFTEIGIITDVLDIDLSATSCTLNGIKKTISAQTLDMSNRTVVICAFRMGVNITQFCSQKVFSFKIYTDSLLHDFIPCKNPENQVGLYDIIGKKFYGNSGTGEFIAGNAVQTRAKAETNEPQGIARREMYVDAKDLQKDSDPDNPMTDTEYLEALTTRGQEKLSDAQLVQSFDASIRTINPTYEYGKDFLLGDTITVIDKNLGVTVDAVVESVQRSISSQGEQLSIGFGYSTPTLYQKLRKAGIQ